MHGAGINVWHRNSVFISNNENCLTRHNRCDSENWIHIYIHYILQTNVMAMKF